MWQNVAKCGVNNNRGCHGCVGIPINIEANNLPLETLTRLTDICVKPGKYTYERVEKHDFSQL